MKNCWSSLNDGLSIHAKLKHLRNSIRKWNKNEFGNCFSHIQELEARLDSWDWKDNSNNERRELEIALHQAYTNREEIFKQKSRVEWESKGDQNTSYFHKMMSIRQRTNQIDGIMWNDNWITNPGQVKSIFAEYFKQFFMKRGVENVFYIANLFSKRLSGRESISLEEKFSREELQAALNSMNSNKSPGPDGINAAFLKNLWHMINKDVFRMANQFHVDGSLPPGLNSSFITLIPKISSPMRVTDFRPISLINCSLKILLKLLSIRLSRVLKSIISEEQFAFIKGRNISESVLIVQEIVHSMGSGEVEGIILKLDFAKAFDSVNWSLLFQVLKEFGFGEKWQLWLESILSTTRMSVLVNGSPSDEFGMGRGLRQGDPLSPMLFNIVSEVFHLLMVRASEVGLLKGISLGKGPSLSHVLFADDTIIFVDNRWKSCWGVRLVLILF